MNNIAAESRRISIDQKTLAERIGVSLSTVSRWERGAIAPNGRELILMHKLFGCSTDYLLGLTAERNHA